MPEVIARIQHIENKM